MKRFFYPVLLGAAIALTACSTSSDPVADVPEPVTPTPVANTQTVVSTGLQTIPLVAPAGTEQVTVTYQSQGRPATMQVPFHATESRGSLTSGYVTLYSATPAVVSLSASGVSLAEDVQLTGRVLEASQSTRADYDDQAVDAYFYIRIAEGVPGNDYPQQFFPYTGGGDGVHADYNKGKVRVNLAKFKELDWNNGGNQNVRYYLYSSDGTATGAAIAEEPDIQAMLAQATTFTYPFHAEGSLVCGQGARLAQAVCPCRC